jgi:phasin family protein
MAVSAKSIREQNLASIETAREGARQVADVTRQAAEVTQETIRTAVDTASRAFQGSAEQITRSDRQATHNIEAMTECSAVLVRGFQEISREWLSLAQHRLQRNLEGVQAIASCQNVQDLVAAQTELVRDNIKQIVENSRQIAESSVRVAEEAAQTFTGKKNSSHRRR